MGKIIIGINEIGWVREFNLADVEKISIKDSNIVVNNTTQKGICIKTSSKELIFGTIIKDKYLLQHLNLHLNTEVQQLDFLLR